MFVFFSKSSGRNNAEYAFKYTFQFIYDRNYNRIGLLPRDHAPNRLPVKKLMTSVTQKEKSKGICMEGYPENYHFLLFLCIHN